MTPMALPKGIEAAVKDMGARVLSVRPLEEYKRYRNRILFITCFDDRFQAAKAEFIRLLAKGRERNDRIEVLRMPLPGTGLKMLLENDRHRDWLLSELLQWAFEIQAAGEVYLIGHLDCGAFGGSKAFDFDQEAELKHRSDSLRLAKEIIQARFPGVIVHLYVAVFRKETTSNHGIVDFVDVSQKGGLTISVEARFSREHVAKKMIIGCPDTTMRKTTHQQFGDGDMHFRLNVPGGNLFFNQTDDRELVRHLLDVPIRKCGVRELIALSHPGCTLLCFNPFLRVEDKINHFIVQGNAARHVINDLYSDVEDLKVRPIFGHTFTHEGGPAIAYIES